MADDTLVINSIFDPAGLERGLNEAQQRLEKFGKTVDQSISFKTIGHDVDLATADFKAGTITLEDYTTALNHAKTEFAQLRAQGLEPSKQALNSIDTALGRSTGRAGQLGTGVARLRSGMAQLAVASIGTSSAVGQVAQGFLLLGGGTPLVIGAAAAVTALGLAYEVMTKRSREATKSREELVNALSKRIESALPESTQISRQVAALVERRALAEQEVAKIQKEQASAVDGLVFQLANEYRLRQLSKQTAQDTRDIDAGIVLLNKQLTTEREAAARATISGLGQELASLQTGSIAAADAARRNTIATTDMSDAQRRAATTIADLIVKLELSQKAQHDAAAAATELAQFWDKLSQTEMGIRVETFRGLDDFWKEIVKHTKEADDASAAYARNTQEAINSLLTPEEIVAEFLQKQRDAFLEIADASAGVIRTANQVGLIGDQAAQAALDVLNLADALNKIALFGASTGNVLGAIGAGIGLLGSAFGESPLEREHNQILQQNNERLADLKLSMDKAFQGGAGLGVSAGLLDINKVFSIGPKQGFQLTAEFQSALDQAGLSLTEFARLVEQQTGIQILDSKGRLVGKAFDQARDAVDRMTEAATHFSDSISARKEQLAVRDKLFGGGSDLSRNRELLLGGLTLDPAMEARIAQLNLDSEAGRAAYREWLRWIDQMAEQGKLTVEALGQFASVDELLGPLGEGADALAQAEQDAADAIAEANRKQAQAGEEMRRRMADAAAAVEDFARQVQSAVPNLLDLRRRLTGTTDDINQQLRDALAPLLLQVGGGPLMDQLLQLRGLDLTDPAAQAALRQQLEDWVNQMLTGAVPVDAEALQAFLAFLNSGTDILDSFNQSVQDATKSLLNVPQGLNLMALEFQASAAGGHRGIAPPGQEPFFPFRGTDGSRLPGVLPGEGFTQVDARVGEVHIHIETHPGMNPEEIAEAVDRRLQRRQMSRAGHPDWLRR